MTITKQQAERVKTLVRALEFAEMNPDYAQRVEALDAYLATLTEPAEPSSGASASPTALSAPALRASAPIAGAKLKRLAMDLRRSAGVWPNRAEDDFDVCLAAFLASAEPVALPKPNTTEASEMMDAVLAEYGWPANPKNAARAGYVAALRFIGGQE